MEQLIVIGGPSCSGKSFLIEKIQQGGCTCLCEQLDLSISSEWSYVSASELRKMCLEDIERLVVHYDLYDQYKKNKNFESLQELIDNSKRVTILTLWVPDKILIQRNNLRLSKYIKSFCYIGEYRGKNRCVDSLVNIKCILKKKQAYKNGFCTFLYERWFDFINQNSVTSHWLLNSEKPNILIAYKDKANEKTLPDFVDFSLPLNEGRNASLPMERLMF